MNAWDFFSADLKSGRLNHAYMVSGADAFSVNAFLRRAAAAAVCTADNKPCGHCLDCVKAENGTHPDISAIPEEGKKILTEDVSALVDDCYVRPLESARKVFVLRNFDETNDKAQNKLLKILEEPVKNTLFLLGAANTEYVLPTIKSRVKKLYAEDDPSFFLKAASTPEYASIRHSIADMYRDMRSSADILDFVNIFARFRDLGKGFLNLLELYTRDIILYKTGNIDLLLCAEEKNDIMSAGREFSLAALTAILGRISEARASQSFNVNFVPLLDSLLFGILEEKHKHPIKE